MSFSHQIWVLWVLSYRDERDVLKKAVLRSQQIFQTFKLNQQKRPRQISGCPRRSSQRQGQCLFQAQCHKAGCHASTQYFHIQCIHYDVYALVFPFSIYSNGSRKFGHLKQIDMSVRGWVGIFTHFRKVLSGPVLVPGSLYTQITSKSK